MKFVLLQAGDSDPEPNAGPALAARAADRSQGTQLPPAGAGSGEWLSDLIRALQNPDSNPE